MPKVLIVQPDSVCPPAVVEKALQARDIETEIVRSFDGEQAPRERSEDGLLILGGAQSLLNEDQKSFAATMAERIRGHTSRGTPVLGICLGAQLVGAAFDGKISRAPELQFGFRPLRRRPECDKDPLVGDMEDGQVAFTWHEDQTSVPANGMPLLSSDRIDNYGFRVGDSTYGFQCHFEVTEPVVERMLERGRHLVPKNLGKRGEALVREIDDEILRLLPSAVAFGQRIADRWVELVVKRTRGQT